MSEQANQSFASLLNSADNKNPEDWTDAEKAAVAKERAIEGLDAQPEQEEVMARDTAHDSDDGLEDALGDDPESDELEDGLADDFSPAPKPGARVIDDKEGQLEDAVESKVAQGLKAELAAPVEKEFGGLGLYQEVTKAVEADQTAEGGMGMEAFPDLDLKSPL